MAKVTIDAGHGGYDSGATYNGRKEKDDNLEIALAVGEILEQKGVEVEYTRVTDVYDSPAAKAQIANEQGSDVFISVHRNSSPNPNTYSGVETLVYDEDGIKADMANAINEELSEVGFKNLGLKIRQDLAVLRKTDMPALLVEVGFLNTDADNKLLDESFDETAKAIASGIYNTLNKDLNLTENITEETEDKSSEKMPADTEPVKNPATEYRVQVGLYREYRNAMNIAYELEALGFPVEMKESGNLYAVQVGPFLNKNEWIEADNQLQLLGYDTLPLERS